MSLLLVFGLLVVIVVGVTQSKNSSWWSAWCQWFGGADSIAAAVVALWISLASWRRADLPQGSSLRPVPPYGDVAAKIIRPMDSFFVPATIEPFNGEVSQSFANSVKVVIQFTDPDGNLWERVGDGQPYASTAAADAT